MEKLSSLKLVPKVGGLLQFNSLSHMSHDSCESGRLIPISQMLNSPVLFPLSAPEFLYGRGSGGGSHLLGGRGSSEGVKTAF